MYEIPAPERLLEVFRQRRPLPLKLEIRPTKNCNLHCRTRNCPPRDLWN